MRMNLSRRKFVSAASTLIAAPMLMRPAFAQSKGSITITSYGGTFQEILEKTIVKPFTGETGINVKIVPVPDMAKLKAQAMTGQIDMDVVMTTADRAAFGSKEGMWEQLDVSNLDVDDMPIAPAADYVTFNSFAGGVAWNPEKFKDGSHPVNFADYFDVEKFPGRRTLRNQPNETLEAALLADGVEPKDLYPLDVDRAFKALDRIKASIASWVTATPQTISLLQTAEVDFSYSYANRVKGTTDAGGGVPLAFSFDQNLIGTEKLAIPKGSPNKDAAIKYIEYVLRPEVFARLSNAAFIAPNSRKALAMLTPEVRKWVPDLESPKNVIVDGTYWRDNFEDVSRRFKEWVLT